MKRVRVRLRIPLLSAAGLLALLVMAMPPPARADSDRPEYERTFQKTIAVKGGQRLEIEHSQGAVRVSGQNVSELKIAAKIRVSASDEAEGRKFGEAIEISVEESSGGVHSGSQPRGMKMHDREQCERLRNGAHRVVGEQRRQPHGFVAELSPDRLLAVRG